MSPHQFELGVVQLATPLALLVRTLPAPGVPPVIWIVPATVSFAVSAVPVPIPILPPSPYIQLPIESWFDPVADATLEEDPIAIFDDPVVILEPALLPRVVLLDPVVFQNKAHCHTAVL